MWLYIIISLVIVIIALILIIYVQNYNKFQDTIIKISEAEENINILLVKKIELIVKINDYIERVDSEKILFEEGELSTENMNNFELNKFLVKYDKKIRELTKYSKEIVFDESSQTIIDEYNDVNISCKAAEVYYNDNVVLYNKLIKCFPSNIVGKILRLNIKEFYSNEKEEIFEILKK